MTYSRKAITQLNRKYKSVLMKCALINAGLFMVISPAMGVVVDWNYNGEGEDYGYVADNPLTRTTNITGLLTFIGSGMSSRSILNGGNSVRVFNVAEGVQNAVLAGYYHVINGFANQGGGLYNSGTISISKNDGESSGIFSGNMATRGGAIYNNGIITGINGYFNSNGATDNGGAIYNKRTIEGNIEGSFYSNSAENWEGGAIYNAYGATINGINASFDNNTANKQGGAIHNEATIGNVNNGTEVAISGSFVSNSSGVHGGAISNVGVITNINSNFSENTSLKGGAINNYKGTGGYDGWGGVFDQPGEISKIEGSFISNSATSGNGGAINNEGKITTVDASFSQNLASNNGGAIFNEADASSYDRGIEEIKGSFTSNSANNGGAVYNKGTISNINKANMDSEFNGNSAVVDGGAIYNEGTISNVNATFRNNTAGEKGGAIYNKGTIANFDDATVNENAISNYFSSNSAKQGGAIFNVGTIQKIKAYFSSNRANEGNGGAIYNKNGGIIDNIIGGYIKSNVAGEVSNNEVINSEGGAIFNEGNIGAINVNGSYGIAQNSSGNFGGAISNRGTITAVNAKFDENTSKNGGAIYNKKDSAYVVDDETISMPGKIETINGSFTSNEATNGNGGAIYNDGDITSIGATFTSNSATGNGGAIYNTGTIGNVNNVDTNAISGSFDGNEANRGGAIYNKASGLITSLGGSFESNSAGDAGGALFNEKNGDTSGQITTLSANFTSNSATNNGGAVYSNGDIGTVSGDYSQNNANNGGGIYNSGNISSIASGASFTSNSVSGNGGAIFNDGTIGDTINVDNVAVGGSFTSNSAGNNGGAIRNNGRITKIIASFSKNKANGGFGGAIYNANNMTINSIDGATFSENEAKQGGGALLNEGNITSINATFSQNKVLNGLGGAILNFKNTIGKIVATFTSNSANQGGAIYNNEDAVIGDASNVSNVAIDGIFTSNSANQYGGAIYNNGRITNVDADFKSNSANQGGAIYNTAKGTIDVIDGEFDSNIGNQSGGAIANVGNIGTIKANFRENGANTWNGGGIFNSGSIDNIASASFRDNTAIQNGGAIAVSSGSIGNIHSITDTNAEFSENHAGKFGGAIINEATINKIVANFNGNYVSSDDYDEDKKYDVASGGAIYNQGTITNGIVNSSFKNNYAKNESGNAFGGAIYTNKDLSIVADNYGTTSFSGNYVEDSNGKRNEAVFVGNANANLTLSASNNGLIRLDDYINGESGYNVAITGDSSGTIELNNDIKNADVSVEKVKIDMSNGNIDTRTFMTLKANNATDNAKWEIDVKFEDSTSDKIVVTNASSGATLESKILVDKLNLVGDVEAKVGQTLNFHVLNTQDENIQLALGSEVVTNPIVRDDILYSEEVKENTLWTDTYNRVVGHYEVNGIVGLTKTNTTNDTISFEVERVDYTQKTVLGDTLAMVNNAENLTDKAFNFESENDKYVATDNLGETKGNVSVNGVANGDAKSEISLGNYSGFEVGDNTNLSINNTKVVGNGSVLDVREGGSVNLDNAVLDGQVTNKGEIVAENTVFDGEVRNDGVIDAQDIVLNGDVTNNNSIVAEDIEFGGDVVNDGVIEATNGSIELNGDVSGDGLINVNNSDLIINAKFDDNDITLNGGNISLGDNADINGGNLVVEAGNIDILAKKVNVDSAEFGANSTLALKVDSLSEYGVLNAKDSLEIEEGATLKATLAQGLVGIGKTEEVKLLTSDNDFENNFTDVMENNMYSFVKKEGDIGVYEIRQTKTAQDVIEENGGSSVNQGSASAWVDGDSFENDSVAKDVADKLADMAQNNAKEFDKALTTLAPDLAPIVKSNVIHHGGQVFGVVSNRLSNGGIANGKGMASGDSKVDGGAVWVQTIGNISTLDGGENSSGFESKTAGVTLGVEKQIDDVKVGVGYAYSQSDIDADNNLREIEVDTHTALIYGEYKPNNWFINTQIAYAFADYDETKRALGSNYMAQYDVETLGVQALTGYDFRICRDKLTPIAGLRYYHIKRDGYMDSAMQYVSSDTMDILTAVLGVKFEGNVRTELGSRFVVRTHANLTYDLITDRDNAYVGLQNGSSYFVKGDSLERLGVEVGGSIGFNLNEAIDISIGYEGRFREDFQDHTGILSAKYKL